MNSPVRDFLSRVFSNQRKSSKPLPRRQKFFLEPLESRILLSVTLFGIPEWVDQGPAPTTDGQVSAAPDDAVSGAIEALAAHPTNADILYAGGVAGGIWKTTNATSTTPTWTPLTDQYRTLAISDLAFSPLDATSNTLFAGTGGFSNGGFDGPALGALRTTDGGNTWVPIGSEFSGERLRSMVPTAIGTSLADQVVLVATIDAGGVYRSTDGGDTFTLVSGTSGASDGLDNDADGTTDEAGEVNLPTGSASYLVGDPSNINRFYAAIPNQGVFRSENGGANWVRVNNGLVGLPAQNIELSVSVAVDPGTLNNPVYAGFVTGGALTNVFRSDDLGANWTAIGAAPAIHPGNQGFNNFSILADAADDEIVYVGGDRQAASPFVGNLFRGDAGANSWTDISDVLGTAFTAPHADSRDMVFDANGDILEADDGGIFRLQLGVFDIWENLNRNLSVTEFYSTPYDHVQNVIFGGTQDTGSTRQTGAGSLTWDSVNLGDGGTAGVGYGEFLGSPFSVEYTMGNNFGTFERHFSDVALELVLGGGLGLSGLDAADSGFTGFTVFPYEVNPLNAARLVIGGLNNLYESTDFGDNLTIITPATDTGVSAIAYGGSQGGAPNPDVIYAGIGGNLYLRTTPGGGAAFSQLTAYTGGTPQDIVIDPDDWARVYVTDGAALYHSVDAGATWTTINTAGLAALTSGLNTVEVFSPTATPGDEVLLVGSADGVFRTRNPSAGASALWSEFGAALPNTPVTDVQYDETDDVLVAGTFGRGAWIVENASDFLPVAGVVQVDGDDDFPGQDDIIKLIRDENVPSLLEVFLNNLVTPVLSVPITAVEQINVNGLGGNDTLMVESTNGLINVVNGIRYDGGDGSDELQLLQTDGPTLESDTYSVGPDIGSGVSTIVGAGMAGTQTVFFEDLEPVLDLVPAPLLTINATPEDNAISYAVGSVDTQGLVAIDEHESIEFANKTELVLNAGAGADTVSLNNADTPAGLTDITVDGGDPSGGDALVVTGGGDVLYTPTASDSGTLDVSGLPLVTIARIEQLLYDGDADVDSLTVAATGGSDIIVHTPGTNDQAGSFQVNSLLAISYQNLGGAAILTAAGASGTDTLIYNGTAANDTFTVGVSGQVNLNTRLVVNTTSVEALTLEGFDGDDTFTLVPAISASVYPVLNFNGGAGADRVNLIATAGDDDIAVSGQVVSLGGVTVNSSDVEDIRLDALAGDDLLTYNGVSGVTEDITVSSSGVVGGGQVSVPGVALVNFSNVERIDVNGNIPTPTETDSLTFAGTNAADMFQINLAAAGDDDDPILTLQDASLVTLLTLRNYTNFSTLRVLGLDGADTFNVLTDPVSPVNRNLSVDGGLPAGKKKLTDKLNVFYTSPRPKIIQSAATQDPDAGLVDLDYGSARFLVQYDAIEQVVIRKS